MNTQILIVDYGSQYTLLIARIICELGYNCKVLSFTETDKWLTENTPKLVILSGGDKSVYAPNSPQLPVNLDTTGQTYNILGICYGMQLLAHTLGGKVSKHTDKSQYGGASIEQNLFSGIDTHTSVWMSHGDSVIDLPKDFTVWATSGSTCAGIVNKDKTVIGMQFHPEVFQTISGKDMFKKIIEDSKCISDWSSVDIVENIRNDIRKNCDTTKKILLGLSGGVDSSVVAGLLAPVFGKNLHAIIIDHGGLRKGERDEAIDIAKQLDISFEVVDLADEFIDKISAIDRNDPKDYSENLRKVFAKDIYKKIFEDKVIEIGASYIAQGTNAADRTESGEAGNSALIKTHHNVGLDFSVEEILPIANLYKYQIREIGRKLGFRAEVYNREPFPGPGLYLRIVDCVVTKEKLDLIREADYTVRSIIKKHNLNQHISQLVVAILGCFVVGVRGDERSYDMPISIRAVVSNDFMTAEPFYFDKEIINEITSSLTQLPHVSRVLFDMTPKPPATTEYQ